MENHTVIAPFLERRLKPRMKCNYPAMIEGQDGAGKKFKENGRMVNLSRSGIFVLVSQAIPDCHEVTVHIVLPPGVQEYESSKLTMTGKVVRSEPCLDGTFGVAIKFQKVHFF
jgi:hypothetical protein